MAVRVNPQDFVLLTGPILIASSFNWGLLGVLILQVYNFYISFPTERAGTKVLVYTLLTLDILQTAFTSHYAWYILVSGWGDPGHLSQIIWSGITIAMTGGIVSGIVQIYFAWRIWSLMGRSHVATAISSVIVLVALMQSISAIVVSIRFAIASADVSKIPNFNTGVEVWLAGSFVCDILIAGTMVTIFAIARRQSPWKRTDTLLTRLIVNTVETGAITAVTAGVDLLLYLLWQDNFLHQVPAFILGKLYSNVVLAILNSRKRQFSERDDSSLHTAYGVGETHDLSYRSGSQQQQQGTVIRVNTEVTVDTSTKKHQL